MANMYYENDGNLELLKEKKVAVIGFGSQGHAHALNLFESGVDVIVGLYKNSKSWELAESFGLKVMEVDKAVAAANITMILIPDEKQAKTYNEEIEKNLKNGDALAFAHGFNINYGQITPPKNVDVFMIAPKGPGHLVRRVYQEGKGVPCLMAVHQDYTGNAKNLALAYAKGLGALRAGVIETTFREETETDLFGEQCVLCGGITELIKAGFDTLIEAGYQKEIAYFECLHEMKLIVDLLYEGGFEKMRYSVSDTAEYGDYITGKRIVTKEVRNEMKKVLEEIQNGEFAKAWILENMAGRPVFNKRKQQELEHSIVKVGKNLRDMMSWLKK